MAILRELVNREAGSCRIIMTRMSMLLQMLLGMLSSRTVGGELRAMRQTRRYLLRDFCSVRVESEYHLSRWSKLMAPNIVLDGPPSRCNMVDAVCGQSWHSAVTMLQLPGRPSHFLPAKRSRAALSVILAICN